MWTRVSSITPYAGLIPCHIKHKLGYIDVPSTTQYLVSSRPLSSSHKRPHPKDNNRINSFYSKLDTKGRGKVTIPSAATSSKSTAITTKPSKESSISSQSTSHLSAEAANSIDEFDEDEDYDEDDDEDYDETLDEDDEDLEDDNDDFDDDYKDSENVLHSKIASDVDSNCSSATPSLIKTRRPAFQQLKIASHLWSKCPNFGFDKPTAVQISAIPHLMNKTHIPYDVIIQHTTGSGKTLAYLLPLLSSINNLVNTTQAIIIAPTRELATQIYKVAKTLNSGGSKKRKSHPLTIVKAVGRVNSRMQTAFLHHPPHMLIGTPHLVSQLCFSENPKYKCIDVSDVKYLVLDEVDSLIEDHSLPYIQPFFKELHTRARNKSPRRNRLVFVSATITEQVVALAKKFMYKPHTCTGTGTYVGAHASFLSSPTTSQATTSLDTSEELIDVTSASSEQHEDSRNEPETEEMKQRRLKRQAFQKLLKVKPDTPVAASNSQPSELSTSSTSTSTSTLCLLPSTIRHVLYHRPCKNVEDKVHLLCQLWSALAPRRFLIFVNAQSQVAKLILGLTQKNFRVNALVSDCNKEERHIARQEADKGRIHMFICTDMAHRGLDLKGKFSHVINLDCPVSALTYLHRAGRVDRVGGPKNSTVINIVDDTDEDQSSIVTDYAKKLNINLGYMAIDQGKVLFSSSSSSQESNIPSSNSVSPTVSVVGN